MVDVTSRPYSAPALEKGLDILELLASEGAPLTLRQLTDHLSRSRNEIFRMVHVLIERGYVARDAASDGLTLTNKLFSLGMQTPRARGLVSVATPILDKLAETIRHSVHLVVANRGETVVIGVSNGGSDMNFSLRLGYRRPLIDAHSGLVLIAFQPPDVQSAMIQASTALMRDEFDSASLHEELTIIRSERSIVRESRDILGVTDIACPIIQANGRAVASIIVAYVNRRGIVPDHEATRRCLETACADIAAQLDEYSTVTTERTPENKFSEKKTR